MIAAVACHGAGGGGAASPSPTPPASQGVPDGYRGAPWGASRDAVTKSFPGLAPSKKNPSVWVRPQTIAGAPATEAFFFDSSGALDEVELRYEPKRSPEDSAALLSGMDGEFGAHVVALADEAAYQVAWLGSGTDVRLTYDTRDEVPFGPVVSYAPHAVAAPESSAPSGTPVVASGKPGDAFAAAVKAARARGLRLVGVDAGKAKLALTYGNAGEAIEVDLTADPKTGALLGAATLTVPSDPGATKQPRAEDAIDALLAKGAPDKLTRGTGATADLVTIASGKEWVTLDPRAGDALSGRGP